tara:strand:- start:1737 stop:2951 length:1215 start_codon:yes stop_codon:yes gene_type:complete
MSFLGQKIRKRFPILQRKIRGKRFVYLDSSATTQKPIEVIEEIQKYYLNSNANVHRGLYKVAEEATLEYEASRKNISNWFGVSSENLIFTRGTTESLNFVAKSWGEENVFEGDRVLVPISEHHSNYVPWQMLCEKKKALFVPLELSEDQKVDKNKLEKELKKGASILAFSAQGNVLGKKEDVKSVCNLAKKYGTVTVVDGAQAAGHSKINVEDLGCDFFSFSGHKMFGPMGIGGLIVSNSLLMDLPSWHGGGEMISDVQLNTWTPALPPYKFEAGTPNVVGAIGLSKAVDVLDEFVSIGLEEHVQSLSEYTYKKLQEFENVNLLSKKNPYGAVSFWVNSLHPHDLATVMDQDGIAIRAGHHCAKPLHNSLGVQSSLRASFHAYNDFDDIDMLINSLKGAFSFLL